MTGAWLLAGDENQISDCTGGHKTQFDTASQDKYTIDIFPSVENSNNLRWIRFRLKTIMQKNS